jgi:ubiquinone/menaquinone biosynthesis C-methylase UbiE
MVDEPNSKKQALRDVFTRTAGTYRDIRYFETFGRRLVDAAALSIGDAVLDVACGRGAVLFPAAEAVGDGGSVVGMDLAEGMARETQREIDRRGLKNATARAMDAERLEFADASFDAVLCGFSLQFFPDLPRALNEFMRVLKPGGTIAVSTWGDDDAAWAWFDDLRKKYGAALRLASHSLDTPEKLTEALRSAKFDRVDVTTSTLNEVFADEEEWWNVEWSISGRAALERLAPERLAALKEDAFAAARNHRTGEGLPYILRAFIGVVTKPA